MNNEYRNLVDILLDEENSDPVILFNENGKEVSFEQIALIPLKEKLYAILKPVIPMEGLDENEGLVLSIELDPKTKEEYLQLITDEKIIDEIFKVYESLIDSQN